jgi:hypothetical protein
MAEFLTTQGASYWLENIIINAANYLVLISPYYDITGNFLQRLQDADKRKVKTIIVYREGELKPEERLKLQKLKNLSLRYCKNLHAKCYLNENSIIITSMNMYAFSEKNNREMGVLIHKDNEADQKIYERAMQEVKSILDSAKAETSTKIDGLVKTGEVLINHLNAISEKHTANFRSRQGYCIRCAREIPYDPDKPYCRECFYSWSEWENPSYVEKYCHSCGKKDRSSMLYPQCRSCFQKTQRY